MEIRPLLMALGLPDMHAPHQDQKAIELALKIFYMLGGAENPENEIILYGDVAELASCTSHPQDPDLVTNLKAEVRAVQKLLKFFESRFPNNKLVYIEGNHEYRFHRYLRDKAPALFGITEFDKLLGLDGRKNWTYVPYGHKQKYCPLGTDIFIKHEPEGSSAKAALNNASVSHLYGHTHRIDHFTKTRLDGQRIFAGSPGCLIDVNAKIFNYQKRNSQWRQGFHLIFKDPESGRYWIDLVEINDGKAMYGGVIYE
jgi:predicted phosphodiesterase